MAGCPRCQDADPEDGAPLCQDCAPLAPSATVRRTLAAWRDHLPTLLLFWAIPALASGVTRWGVLVRHEDAFTAYTDGLSQVVAGADPTVLADPAGVLAPWLLADSLVTIVFFGAIHAVALGVARGEDPGPVPGLRTAGRRLLPILATGLAFGLAVGLGTLLLVLPGLFAFHRLLLALPAAGAGHGPLEALRRSSDLVRDHGSVLLPVHALLLWFATDAVAVGTGDVIASTVGVGAHSTAAVIATGIVEWFVAPILPLFVATYHVHLEAARRRDEEADETPEAETTPHEEVTIGRCPDCGAYVPDDPEEHPTCPTCGRVGPLEKTS